MLATPGGRGPTGYYILHPIHPLSRENLRNRPKRVNPSGENSRESRGFEPNAWREICVQEAQC